MVKRNWLLITRSGSVRRSIIATKMLEDFALSDDLIRIPTDKESLGYVYVYLNSWIGKALLSKNQYGMTVKHIEPNQVARIPIPFFPDLEKKINNVVCETQKLREGAQSYLSQAEESIYTELNLPRLGSSDKDLDDLSRTVKIFDLNSEALDLRLDVSYHLPVLKKIEHNLNELKIKVVNFGDKISSIFMPPPVSKDLIY